ncbi:hypothetical protein R3P38DRAFT_3300136 [Favolaschia claudopus]|uniref:Uncharacterized protein n=1 Tax=Favolaschia claudopus TaxID=2862362 RepID=A0AAV9YY92_9AGAR
MESTCYSLMLFMILSLFFSVTFYPVPLDESMQLRKGLTLSSIQVSLSPNLDDFIGARHAVTVRWRSWLHELPPSDFRVRKNWNVCVSFCFYIFFEPGLEPYHSNEATTAPCRVQNQRLQSDQKSSSTKITGQNSERVDLLASS